MSITDWPVHDRPREKLLNGGVGALTDAELLAIFLRVGVHGKSAVVDLAHDLITHFGSLHNYFMRHWINCHKSKAWGKPNTSNCKQYLK